MRRLFTKSFVSFLLALALLIPSGLTAVSADEDQLTLATYGTYIYSDVSIAAGKGSIGGLSDYDKQKVVDEINRIEPDMVQDSNGQWVDANSNTINIGEYQEIVNGKVTFSNEVPIGIGAYGFAFKVNGIKKGEVTVKLAMPNDDYWNDPRTKFRIPANFYALIMQYNDKTGAWTYDQLSETDDIVQLTFDYEQSDIVLVMLVGKKSSQITTDHETKIVPYQKYKVKKLSRTPEQELMAYTDTNPSTPHIENIEWMSTSGVSKGWDDGTFRPMDTVKRQDMAAFLRREAIRLGVKDADKWAPTAEDWKRFKDVNQSTPHAEDILWLASTGITTGYADGTYQGIWPVYRQDMAAFLHRLAKTAGFDKTGTKSFTDVDGSTPHAEDISWLGGTGISTGYADGTYQGMWHVYRQDMAAFINRLDNFKN